MCRNDSALVIFRLVRATDMECVLWGWVMQQWWSACRFENGELKSDGVFDSACCFEAGAARNNSNNNNNKGSGGLRGVEKSGSSIADIVIQGSEKIIPPIPV